MCLIFLIYTYATSNCMIQLELETIYFKGKRMIGKLFNKGNRLVVVVNVNKKMVSKERTASSSPQS